MAGVVIRPYPRHGDGRNMGLLVIDRGACGACAAAREVVLLQLVRGRIALQLQGLVKFHKALSLVEFTDR